MKFEVQVNVMPQKALLDPQGKAIQATIPQLGINAVREVRVGKHFTLQLEAENESQAQSITTELCTKLLSNPVMEGFEFSIRPVD